MSFPPGTEMFQFPGFALMFLYIQNKSNWFNFRITTPLSPPQATKGRREADIAKQ
jgi:hypothetical protein